MRLLSALFALVVLSGCAPPQPGAAPPAGPERVEIRAQDGGTNTSYDFVLTSSDGVISQTLASSSARAWSPLLEAYQEMGLPITSMEPEKGLVASQSGAARGRKVAGKALSRYLDCGRTGAGAPAAASYPVSLSVVTVLAPLGEGSVAVRTAVTGRAQDPVHNNPASSCSSTGRLEAEIADRLRERTGA